MIDFAANSCPDEQMHDGNGEKRRCRHTLCDRQKIHGVTLSFRWICSSDYQFWTPLQVSPGKMHGLFSLIRQVLLPPVEPAEK